MTKVKEKLEGGKLWEKRNLDKLFEQVIISRELYKKMFFECTRQLEYKKMLKSGDKGTRFG